MISPWFFHEIPIKSISCISHQYSISPYLLTHIQPSFIPWNPQEIPRKSPWKYLWDTQNSDSGVRPRPAAKACPSTAENRWDVLRKAFDGFDWGKKGTSAWNAWIMSYRWIGYDWLWLGLSEKNGYYKKKLTPEPPICHGDPNVGCPDHMIFLLPDGVPRLKTAVR